MRIQPVRPLVWSGLAYFAIGVASALVTNPIADQNLQAGLRFVALALGGLVFGAHLRHELLVLGHAARRAAARISFGASLAGLLLAAYMVAYNLAVRGRSFGSVALVLIVWPVVTGVLGFGLSIVAAKVVVRWRNGRGAS